MRIDVLLGEGHVTPADVAGRVVIVIDVLRAATTVATAIANGARAVSKLVVSVRDLDASTARYEALLGVPAARSGAGAAFTIGGTSIRLEPDAVVREGLRSMTLAGFHDNGLESHGAVILSGDSLAD